MNFLKKKRRTKIVTKKIKSEMVSLVAIFINKILRSTEVKFSNDVFEKIKSLVDTNGSKELNNIITYSFCENFYNYTLRLYDDIDFSKLNELRIEYIIIEEYEEVN